MAALDGEMNINIGDVFYIIERTDGKSYYSNCRVCNGEKTLTVNGFTFRCPACDKEEKTLTVFGYKVFRYRVYSIEIKMPDDDWKISERRTKTYGLYHKHGKGYFRNNHKRISKTENLLRAFLNQEEVNKHNYSDIIYSDYERAVKCAEKLTRESREEVKKYNLEHGTNYDLPVFNIEHDKKSK